MENKKRTRSFWIDESGDFGIKQIAITVAVIVLIGFGITTMRGVMPTWINQLWDMFIKQIEGLMT